MGIKFTSLSRLLLVGNASLLTLLLTACGGGGGGSDDGDGDTTTSSYTITITAVTNGSISPDTAQTIIHGETASFTVTPDTGYSIEQVEGCGGSLDGNTYTTEQITADCTVTANFSPNSYTVTPTAGLNGGLSPETAQTVTYGDITSFTVTPDSLYSIEEVTGCGGTLNGDTYTTGAITADCTVTANFSAPVLSLTPTATRSFAFTWSDVADETEYRLFEDPDGGSGYSQVATITAETTSHDLEVFLPERINASYMLQACNTNGCIDSNEVFVSGSLAEAAGYIKASNTGTNDSFGSSVSLSDDGNTLAVGAYVEASNATAICAPGDAGCDTAQSDDTAQFIGAVYVFTRNVGSWSQQAYIKASNAEAVDQFGQVLTLSGDGNTLVAGASYEDSNATGACAPADAGCDTAQSNNDAVWSGAAYIFTRSGDTWSQQAYLKAPNTDAEDYFGWAFGLSFDGNTLAVGAAYEDSNATGACAPADAGCATAQSNNDTANSGAAYIFTRSGTSWSQQAYIKASNPGANDRFGARLALSDDGNTLAVSATGEDSNSTGICAPADAGCDTEQGNNVAVDSGATYLFTRTSGIWSQQAYIKPSNAETSDFFGINIALSESGNTLAVSSYNEASSATGINGDETDNTSTNSGSVYVFTRNATTWSQQAYIKASNTGADDRFGYSLALSDDGNVLAAGAFGEGSTAIGINGAQNDDSATNSGAVYLFKRSSGTWSHSAYIKAPNTGADDRFGYSLSLSADGSLLAAGALGEGSSATGINGDQSDDSASTSGAVYLY